MSEDRPNLGPAMSQLDERRRAFVQHYVATGASNKTASAQAAGFSPGNPQAAAVTAQRLLKDPRIQAGITETCHGFFAGDLPRYAAALRAIALDPSHRDCVRVLLWLHTTLGISPVTKAELTVMQETTVSFDRDKALAELQRMEREMGVKLLPTADIPQLPAPEEDDGPHILARPERNFRKRPQGAA